MISSPKILEILPRFISSMINTYGLFSSSTFMPEFAGILLKISLALTLLNSYTDFLSSLVPPLRSIISISVSFQIQSTVRFLGYFLMVVSNTASPLIMPIPSTELAVERTTTTSPISISS